MDTTDKVRSLLAMQHLQTLVQTESEAANMRYVIWSFEHHAWWGPNHAGYTEDLTKAGRYTALEAGQIVTNSIMGEEVALEEKTAQHMGAPTVVSLWP